MTAEQGYAIKSFSLRIPRRIRAFLDEKCISRFKFERRGIDRATPERAAGALLGDGRESPLTAVGRRGHAHRAVMLSAAPATRRQICLGVRGQQRRHQHKAEEHQQRNCKRAPHI